jgi:hypothetical protein
MPAMVPGTVMRILIAGTPAAGTNAMLARLSDRGFGSRVVETLRDARDLLGTFRFDVILAAESLADGRGYDLAEIVARRSGTLLVGVALSESCLWLPVVERGVNVLGRRALNARSLEVELDFVLDIRVLGAIKGTIPSVRLRNSRELSDRTTSPRRKNGGVVA